ncbi:MAG: hypothetical protein JST87_05960 [Bacteroidetes bacterium]|nr:hypothetical protein [Bacteroidota bacterium]MBS1933561.1 hypothetical protein [Bacteroidota bacterium]
MTALISVIPNPFTTIIHVEIECLDNNINYCIVRLIDQKGKILKLVGVNVQEGSTKVSIERLKILAKGEYTLDVLTTDGKKVHSMVLTKE